MNSPCSAPARESGMPTAIAGLPHYLALPDRYDKSSSMLRPRSCHH
ncbi:hypothetical protein [Komagataeibacter medellinensis]|nr:hypothetical protein [Komagataeibacter medellinensis]